jgi:hypothetical protein
VPIDTRKPAVVTESFRRRVAAATAPPGFAPRQRGTVLVRRRARGITHRITLGSSHYNTPGHVAAFVGLFWENPDVTALEPQWLAGGQLNSASFGDEIATNVASHEEADALLAHIVERLAWFDLLDDPTRLLDQVRRRYVPGMVDPSRVVPYLRARSGAEAVRAYAVSLLEGRPELWPGFLGGEPLAARETSAQGLDEGSDLARMLARHAPEVFVPAPEDAVSSTDLRAANLRAFLGLQLRAWGELDAAAELRRFEDTPVLDLHQAQKALAASVDSLESVQVVMDAVLGERRAPRRARPLPRFCQYRTRHPPWLDR